MNETQLPKAPMAQAPKMPTPMPQKTTPSTAPMQGNLSIDFNKKNNAKVPYKGKKPNLPQGPKMTSEAFLRHRDAKPIAAIDDPRKLIKK